MRPLKPVLGVAVFACMGCAGAHPVVEAELAVRTPPDSSLLGAILTVHDQAAEESFDPATLSALDQLLLEPMDLNRGALTPLLALPWLSPAHLEALQQARPLANWDALARLPGWDADLVERLRPFVRIPASGPSWHTQVRSLVAPNKREILLRAESAHLRGGFRSDPESRALAGGFIALESPRFDLVAGDFRVGHAQGLLWWSSAADVGASSAPLRRGRGAWGSDAATTSRGLRGAATTLRWSALRLVLARGEGDGAQRTGALARLALGRGQGLSAGWLASGDRQWTSLAWSVDTPRTHVEAEVAPGDGAWGAALAAERRWSRARLAGRLQATPAASLAPLAGVTASTGRTEARQAFLQGGVRWGGARWELALGRTTRSDSLGTRRQTFEQRLSALWQFQAESFELRLHQRRVRIAALEVENPALVETERDRGLVLRLVRRLDTRTSLAVDYRAAENAAAGDLATGSAWQAHFEHRRGVFQVQAALTSFSAPRGVAAPTVPEPGIGAGFVSRRLTGDGLRGALALRLQTHGFAWGVRCARTFAGDRPERLDWALLGRLQIP